MVKKSFIFYINATMETPKTEDEHNFFSNERAEEPIAISIQDMKLEGNRRKMLIIFDIQTTTVC